MQEKKSPRDVFIIGCKGIPAQYGGFETFVEELVCHQQRQDIRYHVACMSDRAGGFEYQKAECFQIPVPNIGPAKAVYYDIAAFRYCLSYIKKNKIKDPVIYVLACRIGPFIGFLKRKLEKYNGTLYVNPDGHEWKRAKWNAFIRKYWKFSERLMVKHAHLLICDSKNIEKYICEEYAVYKPNTTFIAYGTQCEISLDETENRSLSTKLESWYQKFDLHPGEYYLIVGRFVPENNYRVMIQEFLKTMTQKKLVIITNVEHNKFYQDLMEKTHFEQDSRIKFVGTVYDSELLTDIRKNAFGYFHGHEVGGTNPSLLEALATTELNLLLDVGFNREVAQDGALYWSKKEGGLSSLVKQAEQLSAAERQLLSHKAKKRMQEEYSWEHIVELYEERFTGYSLEEK